MRGIARIAGAMALACAIGGCGLGPGDGGPQLTVAGPSAAVDAFVRRQGVYYPQRAATFPQAIGGGKAQARVLMPVGTSTRAMRELSDEAVAVGLSAAIVRAR